MSTTVNWLDHEFTVYEPDTDRNAVPGLYIFSGLQKDDQGTLRWHAFYVGQCKSFAGYIPSHRKWPEAELLGATRVHALTMKNADLRDEVERALIQTYQPPLNVQLK